MQTGLRHGSITGIDPAGEGAASEGFDANDYATVTPQPGLVYGF